MLLRQYAKELSRERDRVRRSDYRCRRLQMLEEQRDWERERQDRIDVEDGARSEGSLLGKFS
jgi:hypothetical protein